jgi:hypothetical protein
MANKIKRHKDLLKAQKRKLRREAQSVGGAAFQPKAHAPSPSRPSLADSRARLEQFDQLAFLRNKLREIAGIKGEWAGIPMPLEGEALVVEPRYPYAKGLAQLCAGKDKGESDLKVRNRWYSASKRADIFIVEHADGSIDWGYQAAFHGLEFALRTLGCCDAWGIEQESNAVHLLGTLVSHRQLRQYMLTGTFMEQSKRSKLYYLFRRLKPTVAIAAEPGKSGSRVVAALCMHPIAYYRGSWAGAMTPTDDVVAHLQMMRGDEAMFWKRSTQHPAYRPEAGL